MDLQRGMNKITSGKAVTLALLTTTKTQKKAQFIRKPQGCTLVRSDEFSLISLHNSLKKLFEDVAAITVNYRGNG